MNTRRSMLAIVTVVAAGMLVGCAASNVDFASVKRPDRASELDAYEAFVGSWTWEAETIVPEDSTTKWSGTAEWEWALDKRCLKGKIFSKSEHAEFSAKGIWSWHPTRKKYMWWMFNDWGFPQEGTATYCPISKSWRMDYKSVGLDGSASTGRYEMKVVDSDTLVWCLFVWCGVVLVLFVVVL
ncbi:MAG: hypothetical protein JSU63_18445, partial [Phycisphaerales bacterium]